MNQPKISVVMPVYNGAAYLNQAIESILRQTFSDFEFVLINDGSADKSVEIIQSYRDSRIKLLHNEKNMGLAAVRNRGIAEAQGEYLAWLDCDDISLPTRLEKQVKFLDDNPSVGLCGTWVRTIGVAKEQEWRYPVEANLIRCRMIFEDPLATSSIMIRRSCLTTHGYQFDLDYPPAEDYELWERLSLLYPLRNIPEVLTLYRVHANQTSVIKATQQKLAVWGIQHRLFNMLGVEPNEQEKTTHLNIGVNWNFDGSREAILNTRTWLEKLGKANETHHILPEPIFTQVLGERLFYACFAGAKNGFWAWRAYWTSPLSKANRLSYFSRTKFLIRSFLNNFI